MTSEACTPGTQAKGELIIPRPISAILHELVSTGIPVPTVGGDIGPSLNAADMPRPMNAFEFAARMWRGAQAMTAMQQEKFGEVVAPSGQGLADLVAFAHDANEQRKLSLTQVPENFRDKIEH